MTGRVPATLAALALAALPAAARAAAPSPAGLAVLNQASALFGAPVPGLDAVPLSGIPTPPAVPVPVPQVPPASGSLVPAGLWASLPAPDAATLSWLAVRVPGLDAAAVRQMSPDGAEAIFSAAAARGASGLDLFTDAGFRGSEIYYLSGDLVRTMFDRYQMRALTPASGVTVDGKPFRIVGLLIGGGRIRVLYDLGNFEFVNPDFPDGTYTLAGDVDQTIAGPGDLIVNGVWVHVRVFILGRVTARIERLTKTGPAEALVTTDHGDRTKPLHPVVRR